jgi:starvation-inducible DNA-binding protein
MENKLQLLAGYLLGLKIMHHAHHWQTYGAGFLADHEMFAKFYEQTDKDLDVVAEKIVGMGKREDTNYFQLLKIAEEFLTKCSEQESIIVNSTVAEKTMMDLAKELVGIFSESNEYGLEQAIGNIIDIHETHMYMLTARHLELNASQ